MCDGVKSPCSGNLLFFNSILKIFRRLFGILIVYACVALPVSAVDDDYLNALESEADDTGSMTQNPTNNPQNANSSAVKSSLKENFEKLLEFELPSTYKFYKKLAPDDQNKVVKLYDKEKKMSAASKLIFDLYFESNK